jgi:hypothetical protein
MEPVYMPILFSTLHYDITVATSGRPRLALAAVRFGPGSSKSVNPNEVENFNCSGIASVGQTDFCKTWIANTATSFDRLLGPAKNKKQFGRGPTVTTLTSFLDLCWHFGSPCV